MRAWLVAVVVAQVACVRSSSIECANGRLCPSDSVCDEIHGGCVSQDQLDRCRDQADGTRCVSDVTVGLCDRGVCLAACGDADTQEGEECDDGNFVSRDGCSSACTLEAGTWRRLPELWSGRLAHSVAFDRKRELVVMFGGLVEMGEGSEAGVRGDTWVRGGKNVWTRLDQPGPPARRSAVMAYDEAREVVVLFGGLDDQNQLLNDTWEWSGTWTQRTLVSSPPARLDAAMTYNSTRGRMVLFGGRNAISGAPSSWLGDLWEYDGQAWIEQPTIGAPPPRYGHAMAYDARNTRLVVFGGVDIMPAQTWIRAQNGSWSSTVSAQPPSRWGSSMAYHPAREALVMFGGVGLSVPGVLHDTWELGASWNQIATVIAPPGRHGHRLVTEGQDVLLVSGAPVSGQLADEVWRFGAGSNWEAQPPRVTPAERGFSPLAYDSRRHRLVLFGGYGAGADTWEFDGARWHDVTSWVSSPAPRYDHALAYDPVRDRTLLFGGAQLGGPLLADLWSWNGSVWTSVTTDGSPTPRRGAAFAADPVTGKLVLFGGVDSADDSSVLRDTWELDGTTWTLVATTTAPHAVRDGVQMAYDPDGDRMVMLDRDGATWAYRAGDWQQIIPASAATPSGRSYATLAYDPGRRRVVLYAGAAITTFYSDLWELDGSTWHPIPYAGQRPPAALAPSTGFHVAARALVTIGGVGPTRLLRETWLFEYRSALADELCTGGIDEDGDGKIDCDDPDCAYAACSD